MNDIFRLSRVNEAEHDLELKEELKAEAVKWVKEMVSKESLTRAPSIEGLAAISEWIMHFFNITEEDLK